MNHIFLNYTASVRWRAIPRLLFIGLLGVNLLSGAQMASAQAKPDSASMPEESTEKPITLKKKVKKKLTAKTKGLNRYDFGFGIGMFSFFLPQPSVQVAYRLNSSFSFGMDLGYLVYTGSELKASGTYFGIDAKYHPFKGSFYTGFGLGQRTLEVQTENTTTVGETDVDVTWTRKVSQNIFSPRIGWVRLAGSSAIIFSLGALMPFGSKFTMTHDPDPIPELTPDEEKGEEEEKGNDVKKYTHRVLPQVELKYVWFFDWIS